jgi:hypothetical protein
MGAKTDGIVTGDFTQKLNDFGRTISYKVVTKTTDALTGEETSTFAAASDQTVIFFEEDRRYVWDKEGLLEVGDAYIIAPTSLGIKRYDQFSIGGKTYYIENTIRRYVLTTAIEDVGTCFLVT